MLESWSVVPGAPNARIIPTPLKSNSTILSSYLLRLIEIATILPKLLPCVFWKVY